MLSNGLCIGYYNDNYRYNLPAKSVLYEYIMITEKKYNTETCCKNSCCADGCCSQNCNTGECSTSCCSEGCCCESVNCCTK